MRPFVIPLAERAGRLALKRAGVESRFVSTPLGEVHAYDTPGRGDLPTTVLLHGIGSAATPFAPLMMRLRRHVGRVVALDMPGHGFSAAPQRRLTPDVLFEAVSSAIEKLVGEPAMVVGNSLGGAVALHHAVSAPARVKRLVLLSPAGARATDEEWASIRSTFAFTTRADARTFLDRLYHRTPLFARVVAHEIPSTFRRRAVRDLLDSATNDHAPPPDALAALSMPVLLVWGRSERVLPERHFDYFKQHLPSHAVVERPHGFGHCPHLDAPDELARRIAAFAEEKEEERLAAP